MTWFIAIVIFALLFGVREIVISWDKDEKKVMMWEILVPASGKEQEFPFEHHKAWDEFVRNMAGGLTILKTAKGEWVSPDGTLFRDRVIPVRINCSKKQIKKIIKFTIRHYNQEAVLAYKISNKVLLIYRDEIK
jgi:hypothetical protein